MQDIKNTAMSTPNGVFRLEQVQGDLLTRVYHTPNSGGLETLMGTISPADGELRYWPVTNISTAYSAEALMVLSAYMTADPDEAEPTTGYSFTITRETAEVLPDEGPAPAQEAPEAGPGPQPDHTRGPRKDCPACQWLDEQASAREATDD